jgi:two-component system, OmpR family, KDP operon response regulator KdpE
VSGARILVVDDEPEIRRALRANLAGHGFEVTVVAGGGEALAEAARARPDLVLLDLGLPDLPGLEVVARLRAGGLEAPIIILSVQEEEEQKVRALDEGADDYLTKPFGMNELLARIRAALRRAGGSSRAGQAVLELGDLQINLERRLVSVRGEAVHLTPKEYEMLRYLAANAGKLITHRTLLRAVWGAEYEDARQYLHVFVAQLRRKLEPDPAQPRYLLTEPGVGYRFAGGGEESGRAAERQSGS